MSHNHRFLRAVVAIIAGGWLASAAGATTNIYGGPTYEQATQTGFLAATEPSFPSSNIGSSNAVGTANYYSGGTFLGERAIRWDASGSAAELGNLGTRFNGFRRTQAFGINSSGAVVGYAYKYIGGADFGQRAVRWDALGAVTELATLGTREDGFDESRANAINNSGAAVGYAFKYLYLTSFGSRAVRWDAAGAVTELGNIGTASGGGTNGLAIDINATGAAVGAMEKFVGGTNLSYRAVRWDASGTAATELGNLGADSGGVTFNMATVINSAGVAVGFAQKYTAGTHVGPRAVRWDASGTAATELGNLGTNILSGSTNSVAHGINDAGTVVGVADKIAGGTTSLGPRAVRWDALGTAATELGNLGSDSSGFTSSNAYAINAAGIAVGSADDYDSNGTFLNQRAVAWGLDGAAIDLNTLLDPGSGWVNLYEARGISDTNWVTGLGTFDPGNGQAYNRMFLLDISSAVPEPTGLSTLALAVPALLLRRKRIFLIGQPDRLMSHMCAR